MTIRRQMILLVALPTLVINVLVAGFTTLYIFRQSRSAIERDMTRLAANYASRFDGQLREVARIAETTARVITSIPAITDDQIYELLARNVEQTDLVYGACMAFEPGTRRPNGELFAPYVCRSDNGLRRMNIDAGVYDWYRDPSFTWFSQPKALGHALWSAPYFDEGAGNVLMSTYSVPFMSHGSFGGVNTIDINLPRIREVVGREFDKNLDFIILDAGGRFVFDPDAKKIMSETIFEHARRTKNAALEALSRRMLSGVSGVGVIDAWDAPGRRLVFHAPIQSTGWVFVCRIPESVALAEVRSRVAWSAGTLAFALALTTGSIFVVSRRIGGRVHAAADVADRIAHGDLTRPVAESTSTDETGQLMRSMQSMDRNLNSLVGNVKQAGIRLFSTATEIAATSKQQEASSATFGAASNQIAAAVKEISATGRDLVKTMESVNRMAGETATLAGSGHASLKNMEVMMRDLDGATASIADKLNAINERSQKITTVITTITKVADQTNILSINAAIEAEKAGEYGSGFLVIAREIRRLADQTASATLDIEQMVQQMHGAVSSGVMEMDRFSDQVRRGVREVASAGAQLNEIIDRVNLSTTSFRQVNESMQSQSEGAQQISDSMASLVANANQTQQSVREFGRAASDLQSAIALLREAVAQFKTREGAPAAISDSALA
ncbi:MAG: methyl-accepting chemotaxis protein [Planctomycetes bacterium]|nr:methyl-accepting chemotaxis protein [Planctomycetota bacterium]